MPQPRPIAPGMEPYNVDSRDMEILGRGPRSRRSKTLLPDYGGGTLLDFIETQYFRVVDKLTEMHAHHHTTWKKVKMVNRTTGEEHEEWREVQEVLTEKDIRQRYSAAERWFHIHDGAIEHYASVMGFTVDRTTGAERREARERSNRDREGSSAGVDRKRWE